MSGAAGGSGGGGLSRRDALRALAAQITLGLAACGKPEEEIVPYVEMPERVVPGEPLHFATTLQLSGYGRGAVVRSIDGRPIKVEGNPRHPASLGATDVFAEAAVLSLYDPDRSRTVARNGDIASWSAFRGALDPAMRRIAEGRGEGLRILTGRVTSPTLARQVGDLLRAYPGAAWHAYEPVCDEAERAGARLAFGRPLAVLPRIEGAEVILALDADPIGPGPDQIRDARGLASRLGVGGPSRLYAVEAAPTLTGAKADNRLALPPRLMLEAAVALANALGAGARPAALPPEAARFLEVAAKDLAGRPGRALVLPGRGLPREAHALVHWINARLRAPVDLVEPPDAAPGLVPASLAALARDLDRGAVGMLVILEANPAYDAPADLEIGARLKRAGLVVHAGTYPDETAALATWHLPVSHALESWGDLRASDGTASIVQPLVRPLYDTRAPCEVLAMLLGQPDAAAHDLVRATWRAARPIAAEADFEAWWARTLHDGVVAGSAAAPVQVPEPGLPDLPPPATAPEGPALVLRPDPCVWDGRFANNAWLQELPKPLTKQVWGNALGIGPADAARLGLRTGDRVKVAAGTREVEAPVVVEPGHAGGVVSLALGYGRSRAGQIGSGVGANAYALRSAEAPWTVEGVRLAPTGRREEVLTTQNVVRSTEEARDLYPLLSLAAFARGARPEHETDPMPTLLPDRPRPPAEHAWAMVIDTAACIGCNACMVACQAENNVPVVGPEEIARGRQMHWLRVDVYDHGGPEHPRPGFQPVPCMHCEHAPCEPVCPVAASVHDGEGLNLQVYNRCVGTRFCEANCPYKVRRFNFFGYADGQEYANLGLEPYKAQKNPEVTVRARGVMEKCTYCVQRISGARRAAERDGRPIGTDAVTTACQDACPTRAITFGDLSQEESAVNRLRRDARHYALLGHLGTRPRTTYLADLRNPEPSLDGDGT